MVESPSAEDVGALGGCGGGEEKKLKILI